MKNRYAMPLALAGSMLLGGPVADILYTSDTGTSIAYAAEKSRSQSNPLRGSRGAVVEQNSKANEDDLSRIANRKMLYDFVRKGLLVPLKDGRTYKVDDRIDYPYARPWTRDFLGMISGENYDKCHQPIVVTSAARTVTQQKRLDRKNPNALGVKGMKASSHLTGATVDITKKDMSRCTVRYLRNRLKTLDRQGVVEATEEFGQPVFHVMVYRDEYRKYLDRILKKKRK